MTTKNYDFGEKSKEKVKQNDGSWKELDVWQSPKYKKSKEKAIELIEKCKYELQEEDFWILMNQGGGKMVYTGLIISHNGCLKINDKLEDKLKFKPLSVNIIRDVAEKEKTMSYINEEQGVYEFGEISTKNCKNDYPYAMVLKRLMDRVILKNSKVGFFGIYSEAESEDFKDKPEERDKPEAKNATGLKAGTSLTNGDDMKETLAKKNQDDFTILKLAIENCSSEEALKIIWTHDDNVKIVNSLKKYQPKLYELIIIAKDTMKASFAKKEEVKDEK